MNDYYNKHLQEINNIYNIRIINEHHQKFISLLYICLGVFYIFALD